MQKFAEGWYALYTRPHHEKKVAERLHEKEISSYLPTLKKLRIWHDRKKFVDEPLFPSYVFVHLKDPAGYNSSLDVEGGLFYIRFDKRIARINDDIINNIRLVMSHGNEIESSTDNFQPGQKLAINQGPLSGLMCEVVRHEAREKILVRVNLLNRNVLANMPAAALLAV